MKTALILAAALGWLWTRVGRLERRVAELDAALSAQPRAAVPAPAALPRKAAEPARRMAAAEDQIAAVPLASRTPSRSARSMRAAGGLLRTRAMASSSVASGRVMRGQHHGAIWIGPDAISDISAIRVRSSTSGR